MSDYYEELKLLYREIKESMQKPSVKEEKSRKAKIEEEQEFFRRNTLIMVEIMKPLAQVLMQKNKKIRDANEKIKFFLPSESYKKCQIYIPFGLHFMISLDSKEPLFILEIIKYKKFKGIGLNLSKKCALDKDKLELAAKELFLKYIRENLL